LPLLPKICSIKSPFIQNSRSVELTIRQILLLTYNLTQPTSQSMSPKLRNQKFEEPEIQQTGNLTDHDLTDVHSTHKGSLLWQ